MTDNVLTNSVRLVSAGSGNTVEVPEGATVAQLKDLANLSDDVQLVFNGSPVDDGENVQNGGSYIASPPKIGHGS